jgi:hypothetical protein
MFEKALSFGGWPGLILLLVGNVAGIAVWSLCVFTRRYRLALYVSIVMFPFSFYAGRAAGVLAYAIPDWDQRIGLTTFLISMQFVVLLVTGQVERPGLRVGRWIEYLLWLFAITLTVSQFATHSPFSAIMLSIGAAWQYVALFYLLTSLIRREVDLLALLNAMFVFSILNIVVRVVAKGERVIIPLSLATAGESVTFGADAGRVGSGALGPAAAYAGYLAIFITLALGVYFATQKHIYLAYVALMFVELLNTFTRGGLFILALLALLLGFKRTRPAMFKVALAVTVFVAIGWPVIRRYAAFRGFSVNVMEVGNFSLRMDLTNMFLHNYHFSWWGGGILKPTLFELAPWLIVPIHNAYLELLDTCGALTFGVFVVLSLVLLFAAVRVCMLRALSDAGDGPSIRLAPFALIALLQWIVFANTTSTSILAYYPYEGTAVFWTVACLPLLCIAIRRRSSLMEAGARRRVAVRRRATRPRWRPVVACQRPVIVGRSDRS